MTSAEAITRALRGRWYGRYGLAFCPAHDNARTPALRLAEGRDGRLLAKCSTGCDFRDVAAALRRLGLLGDAPASGAVQQREGGPDLKRRAEEAARRAKDFQRARLIWAEAEPAAGTLAERYLRARAYRSRIPDALRFNPNAWHPTAKRLPAMIAAVTLAGEAAPVAVHRSYLAEPGRKAEITPAKAMRGPAAGGAVRLSDGPGPLVIAEGIETALSLFDALADASPRVWAALSTSDVSGLRLPPAPSDLVIAPDRDAPGQRAAEALALRAHASGWRVRILPPPGDGMDWNDAAMTAEGGAK